MEPEETTPSKGKKFLKIALWVIGTLAVLIGTAFVLTAIKNAKLAEDKVLSNATEAAREPTEAEKLLKAQNDEMDIIHAQYLARSSSSATTTLQNEMKTLDAARNQLLKQVAKPTNTTIAPKTVQQKEQEMDAIHALYVSQQLNKTQ